ncbi:hypothetical protein [Geobacter anodireducens]
MTESADNDVKNIIGAMSVSAADYAKIQKHGDLDVTNELLDAIDIFRTAKRNGGSIDDHLDQAEFDMHGNMTTVDPTTEALTRGIHEFKGSRKKLTALFKIITQKAAEEIDGRENDTTYGAADMFGNAREKKGKKQIVAESVAQARRGDQAEAGQDDLFRASSYPAGLYLLRKSTGRTHGNERRDQAGKAQDGAGRHQAGAGDEGRLEKAEDGEKACRPNGEGKAGDGPRRGAGALNLLKSHVRGSHHTNKRGTTWNVNDYNRGKSKFLKKPKGAAAAGRGAKSRGQHIAELLADQPVLHAPNITGHAWDDVIQKAKRYYVENVYQKPMFSPAFGTEVTFEARSLLYAAAKGKEELARRMALLPKAVEVIKNSQAIDPHDTRDMLPPDSNSKNHKRYGMYGRFDDGIVISVVVEEIQQEGKKFLSVFDFKNLKGDKFNSYLESVGTGPTIRHKQQTPGGDPLAPSKKIPKSKNDVNKSCTHIKPTPQHDVPMLLKAHVAAYSRTTASGALAHVREHEDSRVKRYGRLLHNVRTHSDLHEVRQARFGHLPNWGQLSDHDRDKILDAEDEVHRRLKEDDAVRDHAKAKERERQKEAMRSGEKVAIPPKKAGRMLG